MPGSAQKVTLSFNGIPENPSRVVSAELSLGFAKHGIAVVDLSFVQDPVFPNPTPIGVQAEWTPVTLDMFNGSDSTRWWGYVHHSGVSHDLRSSTGPVLRYTLIGTSLPMNDQHYDSWSNVSRSGIIREMARRYNLRSIIQKAPGVLSFLPQSGKSDWSLMQDMATSSGYRLVVDGSTVTFLDPATLLLGVRDSSIRDYRQNQTSGVPDSLIKWVSTVGTLAPRSGGQAGRHVSSGVDATTGRSVRAAASNGGDAPRLTTINTSSVVTGHGQAAGVVNASAANSSGWVTAKAVVTGTPSLRPGDVVSISGRTIPAEQRGRWLVTEAAHRYLRNNPGGLTGPFLSYLSLERSDIAATAVRLTSTPEQVGCILRSNKSWQSERLEEISVG